MTHMKISPLSHLLLLRGLSLFSWMGVIFFFSSLYGSEYPYEPTLLYYMERKGAHVIEYAVLMLLSVRFAFALFPWGAVSRIVLLAAVFSVAYGVSDELHQFFVPYRGAKLSDVLIDASGVLLMGTIIMIAAYARKRNR